MRMLKSVPYHCAQQSSLKLQVLSWMVNLTPCPQDAKLVKEVGCFVFRFCSQGFTREGCNLAAVRIS